MEIVYKKKEESFYTFGNEHQIAVVIRGKIWSSLDSYAILTNWQYLEDQFTEEHYNTL